MGASATSPLMRRSPAVLAVLDGRCCGQPGWQRRTASPACAPSCPRAANSRDRAAAVRFCVLCRADLLLSVLSRVCLFFAVRGRQKPPCREPPPAYWGPCPTRLARRESVSDRSRVARLSPAAVVLAIALSRLRSTMRRWASSSPADWSVISLHQVIVEALRSGDRNTTARRVFETSCGEISPADPIQVSLDGVTGPRISKTVGLRLRADGDGHGVSRGRRPAGVDQNPVPDHAGRLVIR